jgi:REP element-mobilizing transposase RayT
MPLGLKRYYGGQDLHFITCSCYRRQPWLGTPARRTLFLNILEQVRAAYDFTVIGYVVMPEHIHLLLSEPNDGNLSRVMQVLKQRVARRVLTSVRRRKCASQTSLRDRDPEHFWQRGSMISTCGATTSELRSCATCTATRCDEGWYLNQISGPGAVSVFMLTASLGPSSSMHPAQPNLEYEPPPPDPVEVRGTHPFAKSAKGWGTLSFFFTNKRVGHPPLDEPGNLWGIESPPEDWLPKFLRAAA